MEHRRLILEQLEVVVRIRAEAALAVGVVAVLVRAARLPELVEVGDEIDRRRAGDDGREHLRLRRDVRRALAAVAVAVQTDALRIGVAQVLDLLHRGLDRVEHVGVRPPGVVVDVGHHHEVAVAHVVRRTAAPSRTAAPRSDSSSVNSSRSSRRASAASGPAGSRRESPACPAACGRPCPCSRTGCGGPT